MGEWKRAERIYNLGRVAQGKVATPRPFASHEAGENNDIAFSHGHFLIRVGK